jgi:hypothetical protein
MITSAWRRTVSAGVVRAVSRGPEIKFRAHLHEQSAADNKYGVKFSELHASISWTMDGDGLKDIVTGKRFWSHGRTGDPDRNNAAVIYWFKTVRGADKSVDFHPVPHRRRLGRRHAGDRGRHQRRRLPDIVVGNKKAPLSSGT